MKFGDFIFCTSPIFFFFFFFGGGGGGLLSILEISI